MKKIRILFAAMCCPFLNFAQIEDIYNARVIGSFEFGSNEITTIYDEYTGCERKTSPHSKSAFIPNESIQIKFSNNNSTVEILKPNLPEAVYANKRCNSVFDKENLVFPVQDANIINELFTVLKLSLLDLSFNSEVKLIINEIVLNKNYNEKIYLSQLKFKLDQIGVDLLTLLKNSLINHGGSISDIEKLTKNWSQIIVSNEIYNIFIFVPFSDEVIFLNEVKISSSINGNANSSKLDGLVYNDSLLNKIQQVKISEQDAKNSPVWILSLSDNSDLDFYPALPWQRCFCTRDSILPNGGISSKGICSKKGECTECGRANFRGECPNVTCPGC
jgi:hypothetical protein